MKRFWATQHFRVLNVLSLPHLKIHNTSKPPLSQLPSSFISNLASKAQCTGQKGKSSRSCFYKTLQMGLPQKHRHQTAFQLKWEFRSQRHPLNLCPLMNIQYHPRRFTKPQVKEQVCPSMGKVSVHSEPRPPAGRSSAGPTRAVSNCTAAGSDLWHLPGRTANGSRAQSCTPRWFRTAQTWV